MSSPLRPLDIMLPVVHGPLEHVVPPGYPDSNRYAYDKTEEHELLISPVKYPAYNSYDKTTCLFCSCSPGFHTMPHPTARIGVNPSLLASVWPMERASGFSFVSMILQKAGDGYFVAMTTEGVLAQLAYRDE